MAMRCLWATCCYEWFMAGLSHPFHGVSIMTRRDMIVGLTGGVAVLAGAAPVAAKEKGEEKGDCFAEACAASSQCAIECLKCFSHCAEMVAKGNSAYAECMKACLDCSEFCKQCLTICARNGTMKLLCCESCAKACDACAKACEKFADDKVCAVCAKCCVACAKCCNNCCKS